MRIKLIPLSVALQIADHGTPQGLYIANYLSNGGWVYEAMNNTDGTLRTASFSKYSGARDWLRNKQEENNGKA